MHVPDTQPVHLAPLAIRLATTRRDAAASAWLRDALASIRTTVGGSTRPLRLALARSRRLLGLDPLHPTAAERDAMPPSVEARLSTPGWRLLDVGRAALVLTALETLPPADGAELFGDLLRRGELSEQESLLRMLPLLPHGRTLLDGAVEAGRTNALPVFAAIALHNPYPAQWFPDLNFNQLVLKAMFMGLPVDHVEGLPGRASDELARMVLGYASEREAAGRSIPAGVQHIVALANQSENPPQTAAR
ncbi:MAG: EboA domain-containing protein [Deltaproteobacteria bacterium]|nr:EboA domain-containing protein [Deltaproteobacteria bacterium]